MPAKTFDWADLLHHHPVFSVLAAEELQWLLQDDISRERNYPAGTTIIHAGEVGDSIFLIGSGSAEAALPLDGGDRRFTLSVMRRGEVFGEMAFFEGRARSATVVARDACVLLEIGGREFRKILDEHPDVEVKVLLKVSERLRNANEQILNVHLRGVDEKLQLFNQKLDVEHRIVDPSLKAAQTVFDQTKLRADEVIHSAERSRTRLQAAATVIGLVIAVFGFFGVRELVSFHEASQKLRDEARTMQDNLKDMRKASEDIKKLGLDKTQEQLAQTRSLIRKVWEHRFTEALRTDRDFDAFDAYRHLRAMHPEDATMVEGLINRVERQMLNPGPGAGPRNWDYLLTEIKTEVREAQDGPNEVYTQYLLVVNALLAAPDQFEPVVADLRRLLIQHRNRGLQLNDKTQERLLKLMKERAPEQGQIFERRVLRLASS